MSAFTRHGQRVSKPGAVPSMTAIGGIYLSASRPSWFWEYVCLGLLLQAAAGPMAQGVVYGPGQLFPWSPLLAR